MRMLRAYGLMAIMAAITLLVGTPAGPGAQESETPRELVDARRALADQEYGQLADILLQYLDENPDNVGAVEQIITEITNNFAVQNTRLSALDTQLEKDPEKVEKIERLLGDIQETSSKLNVEVELETDKVIAVSRGARETNLLEQAIVEINQSVAGNDFPDAVRKIIRASTIGRARLRDYAAEQEIAAIDAAVTEINDHLGDYNSDHYRPLVSLTSSYQSANIKNIQRIVDARSDDMLTALRGVQQYRRQLEQLAAAAANLNRRFPDLFYTSLLARLYDESSGDTHAPQGVVTASLAFVYAEFNSAAGRIIDAGSQQTGSAIRRGGFAESDLHLNAVNSLSEHALFVNDLGVLDPQAAPQGNLANPALLVTPDRFGSNRVLVYYVYFYGSEALLQLNEQFRASIVDNPTGYLTSSSDSSETIDPASEYRPTINRWEAQQRRVEQVAGTGGAGGTDVAGSVDTVNGLVADFITVSLRSRQNLFENLLRESISAYSPLLVSAQELSEEAQELIGNNRSDAADPNILLISKAYPQEASDKITAELPTLNNTVDELETLFRALPSGDSASQELTRELEPRGAARFRTFFSQFLNITEELAGYNRLALANINRAAELRGEGDNLRGASTNALDANDGERARELWDQARQRYSASLTLQESEELRLTLETAEAEILNRIIAIEQQRVVREVRELLTVSRRAIAVQDIDRAYEILLQAADLWALTNIDDNPEIQQQLAILEVILTFEEDYNLDEDDPLYPVVGGYLNTANINLERINARTDVGSEEYNQLVEETRVIIQNILSIQPFNTEARTINLALLKIIDQDEYSTTIAELFDAISRGAGGALQADLATLYSLRQLEPDYPNLEATIVELEISAGIRLPPISAEQIEEGNRLVTQAQSLIATGDDNSIDAGRELILRALVINPQNTAAQETLDDLRLSGDYFVEVSLNSDDVQLLNRAETFFSQGSVAQAFVIVENLWQNTSNRAYPPLVGLRRRVTARLGI